jgi:hypothetical protein
MANRFLLCFKCIARTKLTFHMTVAVILGNHELHIPFPGIPQLFGCGMNDVALVFDFAQYRPPIRLRNPLR